MKELVVFLIFAFLSQATAQTAFPQLIGGSRTSISQYPYMAGIFTRGHFTCGGGIINYRSILTAAHCILETASSTSVIVGTSRQDGVGGNSYRVSRIAVHPDYQGSSGQLIADIAVIRTTSSIAFNNNVRPIMLGSSQTVGSNERVTIAGWGMLENNREPDVLHALEMRTISNSVCAARHQNTFTNGWITSEKLCTEGINRRAGVCSGDSGSPLVLRGAVIGVASWTMRPCADNVSVFIRTANHLTWIRSNL